MNKDLNDLNNKIVEILEKNNIKPIISGDASFIETIRIYEEEKIETILTELESLFKRYKSYSLNHTSVSSCCSPYYYEIRFKIEL
ncbi:hypothetical protein MBCUT_08220 [Methanobrevibacter cuticularis]|uniref:Uncharacterized protein n=1 Tax=Methanobrevibacter cuticularis TaxID=47311 RepID=A0A166EA46_9EURY|nr:hypothetical protein [Methanobrevibacter cuticularis]KZX16436.1 hypothetical protein MBCUT_08220 [Methanobrevibacter cuticularis]